MDKYPPTPRHQQVHILPEAAAAGGFLYQYRAKYEIKNKGQLLGWLERYNQVRRRMRGVGRGWVERPGG